MKIKPRKKVNPVRNKASNRVKVRRFWPINPKTRVKKSAKIYSRSKIKKEANTSLVEEAE